MNRKCIANPSQSAPRRGNGSYTAAAPAGSKRAKTNQVFRNSSVDTPRDSAGRDTP